MLLDLGTGLFSALVIAQWEHLTLTIGFVLAGAAFALLPDLDVLWSMTKLWKENAHEHRRIMHWPVVVLPAGAMVGLLWRPELVPLFVLAMSLHYLHDSIGIGWGIQWLYPFDDHYRVFFYQWDLARNGFPFRAVYAWSPKEVEKLSRRFGNHDWIREIYWKCHPYALIELVVFIAACVTVLFVFLHA